MANSDQTSPPCDEFQWVMQIRRILEEDLEDYNDLPVSISDVPKPLLSSKPEAYTPQLVALGPYHHHRGNLNEMERYKLFAARRTREQLLEMNFQHLVDVLSNLEFAIRAHYHRYLNVRGETLAWMMALDASFLLEFLQIYTINKGNKLTRVPSKMSHLLDFSRRKSAHDVLVRDLLMLENQIPLFLLRKVLEVRYGSTKVADETLSTMLLGFLKEVSPLRMEKCLDCIDVARYSHLLELLYYQIVPCHSEEPTDQPIGDHDHGKNSGRIKQAIHTVISFIPWLLRLLLKVLLRIITSISAFGIIKQPIEHLLSHMDQNPKPNNETLSPLLEEIAIPSVTELVQVGIMFSPTNCDLSSIDFDTRTRTFHLPVISLDVNSEVVLRNLVAYETSITSGPLVFTRYVELMNGIIDTKEDVKLLREGGVLINYMKSDEEVAELWNGMSRSLRLSRAVIIDKVIEDVNKYYESNWMVKVRRLMRKYMTALWEPFRFVALVLLLFVMSMQVYCAIHGCSHSRTYS